MHEKCYESSTFAVMYLNIHIESTANCSVDSGTDNFRTQKYHR